MAFKFLAVAAAAVLSATVAQATDLPNKKAPPAGPVTKASAYDWTGAYVGGSLGGARTADDASSLSGDQLQRAVPGVYAGWNYRIADRFVVGVEADANYMGFDQTDSGTSDTVDPGTTEACYKINRNNKIIVKGGGAANCNGNGFQFGIIPGTPGDVNSSAFSANFSIRDLDTLRIRAGYLITPSTMMFATAGLGLAHASLESIVDSVAESSSGYRSGLVIGGGLEHSYANNWSAKIDYLYYDLGTIETLTDSVELKGHLIRAGIATRF